MITKTRLHEVDTKDDEYVLRAMADRKTLAGRSHYPLSKFKIPQKDLNIWDYICDKNGITYAIISSYCGLSREGNGPIMILGTRREQDSCFDAVIKEFKKIGSGEIHYA